MCDRAYARVSPVLMLIEQVFKARSSYLNLINLLLDVHGFNGFVYRLGFISAYVDQSCILEPTKRIVGMCGISRII